MKITKQLLEEMVKEELNEGALQKFLVALGIAGTVAGGGLAGTELASRAEPGLQQQAVEELLEMDQAQVDELRSGSPKGNKIINDIWAEYDERLATGLTDEPVPSAGLTGEPDPVSSWTNENKSRLERIIAEELRKVLKA
jgi:hypothetical protein